MEWNQPGSIKIKEGEKVDKTKIKIDKALKKQKERIIATNKQKTIERLRSQINGRTKN